MNKPLSDKLMDCIEKYDQEHSLSKIQLTKLNLVIEYFFTDITYQELAQKHQCSISTVKRAMKDDMIKQVFGEEFYTLLKGRSFHRKQKARIGVEKRTISLESSFFDPEQLLELRIIKNDDLNYFSAKEIKILETCLLFLKNGSEKGYSFIAEKIGKSKTTISYYLNDENLSYLLKDVFYKEIKRMLKQKTPAPSRLIFEKRETIYKILNYLEKETFVSIRRMASDLQIDNSTLNMYLNDDYFHELKERRKK